MLTWSHLDGRIEQPRGPDDLLDYDALGLLEFVIGRCCGDIKGLIQQAIEFIEFQRTVVERRRQAESVFNKGFLAGTVPAKHRSNLRHCHVALVHNEQEIVREVIEQAEGALAGFSPVEVPAVILDPVAEPDFFDHLEIVEGALVKALGFDEFGLLVEECLLLLEVLLDLPNGLISR